MAIEYKGFRIIVIVLVVLTAAGFGVFTGFAYSEDPLRIAVAGIAGVVSGFILAKQYLFRLDKISAKGHSAELTWLYSTLVAVICGIISTTTIHGTMAMVTYPEGPFSTEIGNIWSYFIVVGEIVGAMAGFVVGGICSLVFVRYVRVVPDELS